MEVTRGEGSSRRGSAESGSGGKGGGGMLDNGIHGRRRKSTGVLLLSYALVNGTTMQSLRCTVANPKTH